MDHILQKLNSLIAISDNNSVEKQTLLRERIEYALFSILGYLWNTNLGEIELSSKSKIVEDLDRMSIGEVVGAIRTLDYNKTFIPKKGLNVLDKYPTLRNEAIGHGYTHEDKEGDLENALNDLYNEINEKIPFIKKSYDLIKITGENDNYFSGIRFNTEIGGLPIKWSCPKDLVFDSYPLNKTFVLLEDKYIKLSPFIYIDGKGEEVYIFQSLIEKVTGNIKMSRLFQSRNKEIIFKELISMNEFSDRRRISSNGTIMNFFENNFSSYISDKIEKDVKDFLFKNRSSIHATIWGHGGVGKTACIQNICTNLFNDLQKKFAYIIFLSAKDRMLDPKTGNLVSLINLHSYNELISGIISTLSDKDILINDENLLEYENIILKNTSSTLLVIDDYETFSDSDKIKIQALISKLNIDIYKIVITTRNKQLSSGYYIPFSEFNLEDSKKFLLSIFENEHPTQLQDIEKTTKHLAIMNKIFEATSGRAVFLYQFSYIYIQKGFREEFLDKLKDSDNAQQFLYGRIYSYLSDLAQKAFVCISQISDEKDLIFKERILSYLLNIDDNDYSSLAIAELVDQKIIEQYDTENYRIYSKELYIIMLNCFKIFDPKFKDSVKTKLFDIGGKDIVGTVFDAMLNEANQSRSKGNAKSTIEKYRRILNEPKADKRIKKTALINLASYQNIDLLDVDNAINSFADYYYSCHFESDIDINKIYAQYLWSQSSEGRKKACDLLEKFFSKKEHSKTAFKHLELFSLAVTYCTNNVLTMSCNSEAELLRQKQRVYNDYGRILYNFIIDRPLNTFKPALKHNFSTALIQIANLCADLASADNTKLQTGKQIVSYGLNYFNEIYKSNLGKINNSLDAIENPDIIMGGIVSAKIICVKPHGLIVLINGNLKGLIVKSEIPINNDTIFNCGDLIEAKIIGKNNRGFLLSLKF